MGMFLLYSAQKEMEETSSSGDTIDRSEEVSEEIVFPKLIKVAKTVYEENWVSSDEYTTLLNTGVFRTSLEEQKLKVYRDEIARQLLPSHLGFDRLGNEQRSIHLSKNIGEQMILLGFIEL